MADFCDMSRKTRTRQTRIHAALQSGYCAICHLPYNSLDDHIQSKKHLKLIGEDANYISINGFIDQNSLEPFLNLNGIDSIDINGRQIEKEFCTRSTRNAKNRAVSLERIGPSPIDSPVHHHLRSRKQINYAMSPSLDEDSFSERPEVLMKTSSKIVKDKNANSKSTTKKVQDTPDNASTEVWNSGRPKRRSCIQTKRISADERLVVDNKTYYKVEVMSTKLRSSCHTQDEDNKHNSDSQQNDKDDKGLIVKFRKLRHAELRLLNNEAENFLFPKKDDSSSSSEDEGDVDGDGANTTVSSSGHQESFLPSSDTEEYKPSERFKLEDEVSMDSTTSSCKMKKKRRTHAEAFIMDNQKYYKFETPGSRLRYHGSLFSELDVKGSKHNGNIAAKEEIPEVAEPEEPQKERLNLDSYQFSFEMVPKGEKWFAPFRRQDLGEESYMYLPDEGCENRLILPYQIGPIPPLDPKICISHYVQLKKLILEHNSASGSRTSCSTPEPSENNYAHSTGIDQMDEDSKSSVRSNSIEFCSENSNSEETKITEIRSIFKKGKVSIGRNPRKSPRQHASTLAILSSLLHQRKKKPRCDEPNINVPVTAQKPALPPIPEEVPVKSSYKLSYEEILHSIHEEWDFDSLTEDIEIVPHKAIGLSNRLGILDVLRICDQSKLKGTNRSRFINGTPGRKPGRRKKLNKTGWPNRKKGLIRKDHSPKEETSSVGSLIDSEEESTTTDSIKNVNKVDNSEVSNSNCDLNRVAVESTDKNIENIVESNDKIIAEVDNKSVVESNVKNLKILTKDMVNNVKNNIILQPIVKVRKLDSDSVRKEDSIMLSTKRTYKRRMPASPKSPRMLRKPRGKWYKER